MKIISFFPFLLMPLLSFAQKTTRMTVHFDFGKADIRPTDGKLLDSLIATFPANAKNISLEIYGYCDEKGTNDYNDTLSLKRAKSVKEYLLAKGVDLSFIRKAEGYGETRPVADFPTAGGQWENRRVELVITVTAEKLLTKTIEDTATKAGSKILLHNLNYFGNTYALLPESKPVLMELLSIMRKYPTLVIAIEGHICCISGPNVPYNNPALGNITLSGARAQVVYNYLKQNGIGPNRLSYVGYEHRFPMYPYPEKTEEERVANRRVEIRIVKK